MTRIFATPDALLNWTQQAVPDSALSLLRSASLLIGRVTASTTYVADPATGLPVDTLVGAALRDAACAQAAYWAANGIDPVGGAAGVAPLRTSKKVGSASITADTAGLTTARMAAVDALCSQAEDILRDAMLLSNRVWSYG